jgi:hypothetical protein
MVTGSFPSQLLPGAASEEAEELWDWVLGAVLPEFATELDEELPAGEEHPPAVAAIMAAARVSDNVLRYLRMYWNLLKKFMVDRHAARTVKTRVCIIP